MAIKKTEQQIKAQIKVLRGRRDAVGHNSPLHFNLNLQIAALRWVLGDKRVVPPARYALTMWEKEGRQTLETRIRNEIRRL